MGQLLETSELRWYRQPVVRVSVAAQLIVTGCAAAGLALWNDAYLSALFCGAGGCLLASLYGARRVFSDTETAPDRVLATLYRAEIGKLVIVSVLFLAAARFIDINFVAICVAFVVVYLSGSLASFWADVTPDRPKS